MHKIEYLTDEELRKDFFEILEPFHDYKPTGVNEFVGFTLDFETGGVPKEVKLSEILDITTGEPIGGDSQSMKLTVDKIAITQISINCFRLKDLKMVSRMVLYIKPYHQLPEKKLRKKDAIDVSPQMIYTTGALDFTHITLSKLEQEGVDIDVAGKLVYDFINMNIIARGKERKDGTAGLPTRQYKPFLLGQNLPFDIGFFPQLMIRANLEKDFPKILQGVYDYYGNFLPTFVDTLQLSQMMFANNESFASYSLSPVCEKLGFPIYDAHDAGADTDATFNVFAYVASKLRSNGGIADDSVIYEQEKERNDFKI